MDIKENQIAVNVLRVSAYLLREGNRIASKYGLNQQQFVVLNYIRNNDRVHQSQICSSLVFEKSNVSKIIKKLEGLGFVEQKDDPEFSRSFMIETTALGRKMLKEGLVEFSTFHSELLSSFSEFERENLLLSTNMLSQLIREKV